jgi:hypothetical protein
MHTKKERKAGNYHYKYTHTKEKWEKEKKQE